MTGKPDRPAVREAQTLIAPLQQSVEAWMDGDQVLPADGSSLLALLERALAALTVGNARAATAEIEAFIGRVQALMEVGVLEAADGRPLIDAAAPLGARLPSADETGLEPLRGPGDISRG